MAAGHASLVMRLGRFPVMNQIWSLRTKCATTDVNLFSCKKCLLNGRGFTTLVQSGNRIQHMYRGALRAWTISVQSLGTSPGHFSPAKFGTVDLPAFEVPEGKSAEEVLKNLEPELARKLKIIQMEFEVMKEMGGYVPDEVTPEEWVTLLQCPSSTSRRRYLRYLRKNENYRKAKEVRRLRNQAKQEERLQSKGERDAGHKNTIFMMVRDSTMHHFYHSRLAHSMMDGPSLVLDMDYEHVMQKRECINTVQQILMAYGYNRVCREPFHLILTGVKPHGMVERSLAGHIHSLMVTTTEKSFLDLYPRDRLVYLSPNADKEMTAFSDDDIYVVGGFVDKSQPQPLSMARAKKEGLRMAKFPLDRHVIWTQGSKALTIDQVVRILLTLKDTGDWQEAFKHLPRRKILR